MWLVDILIIWAGFYVVITVFGYLFCLIRNGFDFSRTHEEMEFYDQVVKERRERQRQENQRVAEEIREKRRERLGW